MAILSVLLIHILDHMVAHAQDAERLAASHARFLLAMNHLGRGVELFFVISGYILALPFHRQYLGKGRPVSIKAFYLRRVTRLEPPYLLSLLLYACALVVFRSAKRGAVLEGFLAHLFYVHNIFHGLTNLNPPTWTLEVEIQFYLVAPLLATVFLVRAAWLRRAILIGLIAGFAGTQHPKMEAFGFYLPSLLAFFLAGYLLADLRMMERREWMHRGWDVASAVLWPVFFLVWPDSQRMLSLCALLFFCLVASLLGPSTRKLLGTQWIAILGGMCYSLYLTHMLLLSAVYPVMRHAQVFPSLYLNYAVEVVLLLPILLLGGVVFFVAVERPCMDPAWPAKLFRWFRGIRGQQQLDSAASSGAR